MANSMYIGVSGVARKVKQPYVGVNGIARKIKNGYVGVSGVARKCFSGGIPISESGLTIGDSVYVNVYGTATEFLIVHQGLPSSWETGSFFNKTTHNYDSSCDGTWLLAKNLLAKREWDSSDNDYANSSIHTYLNGTFASKLDADILDIIKTVKIPYTNGAGTAGKLASGADGLSTKIFLPSCAELGKDAGNYGNAEGSVLDYFSNATGSSYYKAYFNGTAETWTTRTPNIKETAKVHGYVASGSSSAGLVVTTSYGIRPAFIVPSETLLDDNFNIITQHKKER